MVLTAYVTADKMRSRGKLERKEVILTVDAPDDKYTLKARKIKCGL